MDLFKINCPHCGQPLEVPAAMARDTVACPTCNGVLELAKLIPQPIAESMCLQGSGAPQGGGRQRKAKKTGWWIALACMAGLVAVAAIVFFVLPKNNGGESESKSSEPVAAMDQEEREAEARATYELGMEYLDGKKQEQDYDKACELLEKAFELGSQEAIEKLVEIYYYGSHGRRDFDKAMEYAQLGIEKYSNEFCWQTKGLMLLDKGDDEEAYGCFEKAQHYYCSLFSVACMKYSGMGTEIDHRGAVVYFLQASKNILNPLEKKEDNLDSDAKEKLLELVGEKRAYEMIAMGESVGWSPAEVYQNLLRNLAAVQRGMGFSGQVADQDGGTPGSSATPTKDEGVKDYSYEGAAAICLGYMLYHGKGVKADRELAWKYLHVGIRHFCFKLVSFAREPLTREDYANFNEYCDGECSSFTPFSFKMQRLVMIYAGQNKFHRPVKGENYGSDILLEGLLLYFNPDMWQIGRSRGYNVNNL